MTCGIYALYWPINGMIYIGRSINIERRTHSHKYELTNNTHNNYKLQKQYNKFLQPEIIILEICDPSEINTKEAYWIAEFNACTEGLNISDSDNVSYSGTETGKSKYTRFTILKVFSLLYKTELLLKDIAKRLKVNNSLPTNIAYNGQHMWLKEDYPEQYELMLLNNSKRAVRNKSGLNNPKSKYSKRQILKVFSLLYRTKLSKAKIGLRTKTSESLAKSILNLGSHRWLQEEYPEKYALMLTRKR